VITGGGSASTALPPPVSHLPLQHYAVPADREPSAAVARCAADAGSWWKGGALAPRQLVLIGGVCVWALLMVLELVTRNTAFLYAAIVVIVLQVVLSATLRRQ
jgi:hypothetical protein